MSTNAPTNPPTNAADPSPQSLQPSPQHPPPPPRRHPGESPSGPKKSRVEKKRRPARTLSRQQLAYLATHAKFDERFTPAENLVFCRRHDQMVVIREAAASAALKERLLGLARKGVVGLLCAGVAVGGLLGAKGGALNGIWDVNSFQ
ncbi:MAG: hypothetical protein LQ338_000866 [Usnochroma carphineum]|nr:MAG: hypothetical protein LQ338_000866 [Usnochroma carphineum]